MTEHYGEAFCEDFIFASQWGWHCLTCGWQMTGLEDIAAAERAGDDHETGSRGYWGGGDWS